MSTPPEEGGTPIKRSQSPPPQMQQQNMQQQNTQQQMMPQQNIPQQQMMEQQMMQQQMMQQQPQGYQQPQQNAMGGGAPRGILKKSNFGASKCNLFNSVSLKNAILVAVIFLLLNSKIIWKQIMHFPFMGTVEPSIIALVVNSVFAAMVFYLVSNFLMNN